MDNRGTLYIVGTPIGNLGDITLRAIETLKKVDIILAEDTRQTLKLLNHLEISKHCISYHRHNEEEKIKEVVELLDEGKDLALVSDAGMPRISDPGESLIKFLKKNKYKVVVVPGVTAIATAVAISPMDSETFTFEGFLPMRPTRRRERLERLKYETRLMVFYEAPHKLLNTLKDLKKFLGNRNICIARELTKLHEECIDLNLEQAIEKIEAAGIKGEIVLLVEGNKSGFEELEKERQEKSGEINLTNKELVEKYVNDGMDKKEAIKKVAKQRGLNKNEVYMECVDNE
ncbi:MAG: 16S rRNA (cytidine(1402)-2'-O)-methyltransferase [Clostridia bacterium]|nr:16S rRNA (cytidine(1402)-2'-O)-methyltransferase [Clostridia bacterium]